MKPKLEVETRSLDLPLFWRSANIAVREGVEDESGDDARYDLSFSSEEPYLRSDFFFGDWEETLGHTESEVRMDWIGSGKAPLFADHDPAQHIGVVESAEIKDSRGKAVVRLGKTDRALDVQTLIDDGMRSNVSVGYRIHRMEQEVSSDEEPDKWRVTDWEPLEISSVALPADQTVGIGRSEKREEGSKVYPATIIKKRSVQTMDKNKDSDPVKVIEPDPEAFRNGATDAHNRVTAILDTVQTLREERKQDLSELGNQAIREEWTVEKFKDEALDAIFKGQGAIPAGNDGELGLSKKEKRSYRLVNAYRSVTERGHVDGFEKECSDETAKLLKREPKGFFIPPDIMRDDDGDMLRAMRRVCPALFKRIAMNRGLEAEVASQGGFTIGTDVDGGNLIELLRNATLVVDLGAMSLTGLQGNVAIPKQSGGSTAYWLNENEETTASAQTFGQLFLTPHRLAADTFYTKQLLAQSSIDIEAFVRADQVRVLAIAKDLAAIEGSGASGEPLGIVNTTGINATVTFGGAPTWADVVEFETGVAVDNALLGTLAYLTTPSVRGKWKTTVKESGQASYLWEGTTVNGYRAEATNQISGNKVIFGNWGDLILADWEGVDVVVDPFSRKKTSEIEIHQEMMTDVGLRHATSMNVSTDAGNQ